MQEIIIAGVHKAGTTSLFTYLSWHSQICASSIKETHYFSDETYPKKFDDYQSYFKHHNDEEYVLEASPEYIYGGKETIRRIKHEIKNPKIIIVLRDPSDKIYSSFKHRKKNLEFENSYDFQSFYEQYLKIESLDQVDVNNKYQRELLDGAYSIYLPIWLENFPQNDLRIMFFDDLTNSPKEVVMNLCEWLNISKDEYLNKEFTVENKSVQFKNSSLQHFAMKFAKLIEPILRRNYKLKRAIRNIYYSINQRKEETETPQALNNLRRLYNENNKELKELLKMQGYQNIPQWIEFRK